MDRSEVRFHNIQVALHVMGWTHWDDLSRDCPHEPGVTYFADWGESWGLSVYHPEDEGDTSYSFNPAESIADAWRVVEMFAVASPALRHSFTMRLRWAIEDRIGDHCLESEVILRVNPVDICVAAVHAIERDGAEAVRNKREQSKINPSPAEAQT